MTQSRRVSRAAILAGAIASLALASPAQGSPVPGPDAGRQGLDRLPSVSDGPADGARAQGHQHGTNEGHLPPVQRNVELVGKFSPTGTFGDVLRGQIADLAVFNGRAFLNSWQGEHEACDRGGVYVVDFRRRPAHPKEDPFIPALAGNYHGEGAQVLKVRTHSFRGNILAVNNEYCADVARGGGFDLYDVTDPDDVKVLVQGFGDFGDEGTLTGESTAAHSSHNVQIWQDGDKVYAVSVDNDEQHDVDFFDITDPRNPKPIAEFDLDETFPQIIDQSAFGDNIFNHDDVVKKIDGVWTLIVSYWDAGYVKLDVSDPGDPKYLGDTSFDGPDPLTGLKPPEGNAHQAEFSGDSRYVLAADEDFGPFRARVNVVGGGSFNAAEPTDTVKRIADLPGGQLGTRTTFVGQACVTTAGDTVPAAPAGGSTDIAVIVRGVCTFEEKVNAVKAQGWDGFIVYNNAGRPDGDPLLTNGVVATGGDLPGVFLRRQDALTGIFGLGADAADPAVGKRGKDVGVTTVFDGWGYAHLYRNENGKMREVDAYAIPEALDPRYATGFGDLSIHEFAADPDENLAYSSYYSGGLRVFSFGEDGLREEGAFIDEGGNNFWGVEFTKFRGREYIAASDRDYGLYLFRYTGPHPGRQ